METGRELHEVLAGEPRQEGHGLRAEVEVTAMSSTEAVNPWGDRPDRKPVRLAAPLLRVVGSRGSRRVVVGQIRLRTAGDSPPRVTLAVRAAWSEDSGWHQGAAVPPEADGELTAALAHPAHAVAGDEHSTAATMAKAFAESSRDEVLRLRELRYELESRMADHLAGRAEQPLRPLLAAAVELSTAVGRARDQAGQAARQGLWVWLWDGAAYRRLREGAGSGSEAEPSWAEPLRAGVRHCEAMEAELAQEADRLQSLLGSMSTFAVAQGAEAQERFTLAVGAAAAVIGLPALVLALYGANEYLPLDSFDRAWRVLLPIGGTALAAVTAVIAWMPGSSGARPYLVAAGVVAALVCVLLVAGALVPA
ncbi:MULTISPECIES: hypothetical protein [unclassified Nocardiopsis]|uniref:hypothetical protein n=1 Tax=unclassified Nocardiopsis TaxID=2649073 RepID=UPI0013567A7B|nr:MULTISPECIES: hypothetical protein [unclassified Nocardiopsis]